MSVAAKDAFADHYTEAEFSEISGVARRTLQLWRQRRYGPPFVKLGRTVLYPRAGWRAWLEANTIKTIGGANAPR
jgi:hypothetical protein